MSVCFQKTADSIPHEVIEFSSVYLIFLAILWLDWGMSQYLFTDSHKSNPHYQTSDLINHSNVLYI
jgi:hypothetical protein